MVEYKDQLQRVSHLRCFGMYQCVGKSKVRVRSFGEGKDLYLTRAEIFEFADNIKDWCKDMVDPPEEKEEDVIKFTRNLALIWRTIENIEKRLDGIDKSVIMGCGQDAARMDHLNTKIDVIDKEKCALSVKLYDTAEEQNKLEKRIEKLEETMADHGRRISSLEYRIE